MMKLILYGSFFIMLFSCGKGIVEIENVSYEPKVMIEGYLIPGQAVSNIYIRRNFKIDQDLTKIPPLPNPDETSVVTTEKESGKEYALVLTRPRDSYDWKDLYYYYPGTDLRIVAGKTYTLQVKTRIDGRDIQARSTTIVPQKGFHIISQNYDTLFYRQRNADDDLQLFQFEIERSPGVSFYAYSIRALNNDYDHYISGGAGGIETEADFDKDRERLSYQTRWIQNTPKTAGQSTVRALWFDLHFYSTYEVIIYAADRNYREFLQTFARVQEVDGNFHEAKFNIDGDGIGVFGSVIPDTTYITVLTNP